MKLAPLVFVLLMSSTAWSQIANVQPQLDPSRKEGLKLEASGSLELNTGNTRFLQIRGALLLAYIRGSHGILWSSSAEVINFNDTQFSRVLFSHVRYQWFFHRRVTWETFTQITNDLLGRLAIRWLFGGGPRFDLADTEVFRMALGMAYMFEREALTGGAFLDSGLVELNHRLSLYVTGRIQVHPLVDILHTIYVQPRFNVPSDLRVFADTSFVFKFTKRFALSLDLGIGYDTRPAMGVMNLDTSTKVRFTVSL